MPLRTASHALVLAAIACSGFAQTSSESRQGGGPPPSPAQVTPPRNVTPTPAGAAGGKTMERPAEVEISGTLHVSQKPHLLVAFVSRGPCDPDQSLASAIGSVKIDPNVSKNFFVEIFVPQGSTGHVCGAALDSQEKFVAFGAYSKNPLTFRGSGEVTFSKVVIDLLPLNQWKAKFKPRR